MCTGLWQEKPKGKKSLGKPRRRWKCIKVDLREIGYGGMDWIEVAQEREEWAVFVNTVMNLLIPYNAG
jgi:hypothetical protein